MSAPTTADEFKNTFKYFKRRKPPPDLSGVIDFSLYKSDERIRPVEIKYDVNVKMSPSQCESYGMKPVQDWQAFCVCDKPGFIFLQNPFLPEHQRYWIKRCLADFPQKPNVCNLDAHMTLGDNDCLWNMAQIKAGVESFSKSTDDKKSLLRQLRWVTFGYHHNWDTKVYQEDHYSRFPDDLACMTQLIASVFGYGTFKAQAAIINYYHMDSTLGGHTDHSEFDLEMPIISYSFGQSAIFLLGGQTKEQTPTAMYLHSGDIILMGGPSRLAYHALPRVLPCTDGQVPACLRQMSETGVKEQLKGDDDDASICSSVIENCLFCDKKVENSTVSDAPSSNVIAERDSVRLCTCSTSNKLSDEEGNQSQSSHPDSCEAKKKDNIIVGQKRAISANETLSSQTDSKQTCKSLGDIQSGTRQSDNLAREGIPNTITGTFDKDRTCTANKKQEFSIDSEMKCLCSPENWAPFVQYLSDSRINISVRQVTKADGIFTVEQTL